MFEADSSGVFKPTKILSAADSGVSPKRASQFNAAFDMFRVQVHNADYFKVYDDSRAKDEVLDSTLRFILM